MRRSPHNTQPPSIRERPRGPAPRPSPLLSKTGIAGALFAYGCSCGPTTASIDGGSSDAGSIDAGPFFSGIDAAGYEPTDSGPRPPEPCAVPVRRVRFPVGDGSLGHTNQLWASGSRAWVYLGGFAGPGSPPPSMHLFDLEEERELEIDFVPGDADGDGVLGVFEAPTGYEIIVRRAGDDRPHIVYAGRDGRFTGASEERLELSAVPLVRLDDGRYVGMAVYGGVASPVNATLEIAAPAGTVQRIELGFETMSGHLAALRWTGETLVGVGYEDATQSVLRFEVDLATSAVRLATLVEGVWPHGLVGTRIALWSSADTVTVALAYVLADERSSQIAELFWWPIGSDAVTRRVVRPASDLNVGILALGGDMPRQTLVLAQTNSFRTWVTAARIRAPGDVVGGSEPIGVFTGINDAAAWEPSAGTAALALLSQHELARGALCLRRSTMMSARSIVALTGSVALALIAGCYRSHDRVEPVADAGAPRDGDVAADAAVPSDPCRTVCDPPRIIARVELDVSPSFAPAVLDAVVHRDELVVLMLHGGIYSGADPTPAFSLARISRRTGEVRIEVVDVTTRTASVGAAALSSRGETLTLVAAHGGRSLPLDVHPTVLVATWEGPATSPATFEGPLTDTPLPRCPGCYRRGASVVVGESGGIVTLAGEGVLYVGRVALDTGAVVRETVALPSVVPNTALDARGNRAGSALLTLGGLRETLGATESPAFAMVASESTLEAPISIPGAPSDSVPHPWLHDGALEIVRFLRDDGVAGGRLHRYGIEGSEAVEIGTIPTAGSLPPLAIASTPSTLLWVESSLAVVGEADLRVLAAPPATCEGVTPTSVVHLPTPLADRDPRAIAATEADGRTYAFLIEQDPGVRGSAVLVVFDLGACRDGA